ncbi:UNVERIFIED_CONTAM: Helicase and polymerase-containing protein TEBICHI [Sesamum radiatum]|uniref:Helicase and polymerase-containing protein TEBICHI n=1 Tax=Sesamum radiatum TaxID=300843 RepID=A0AAW2L1Y5_SESRA
MASDSPRGRIDQFFSSKKKRKNLSPASKSGRLEKEARNQIEGSPSAKGSLESYLETSKTDHASAKSLNSVCDQNARTVPIQRTLILDSGISSKDKDEDPCRGLPQSPEASGVAQGLKSEVFSDIGSVGTNGIEKDNSQTENPVQISELKEFATGFLSLYCSELKSSVSLPSETKENAGKRHSSSSASQLEEKSAKRRHCANGGNQSNIGDKSISSTKVFQSEEKSSKRRYCATDGNPSNIGDKSISSPKAIQFQSEVVNEIGDIDSNCLQKAIVSNHPFASQASLRKCIYTSAPCRAECETPGSFTTRPRDRETPPSTRGSSLFSPGEAFWNEAILVADELFAPSNGLSSRVAENSEPLKFDYGTYSSNNVKNGVPSSLLNCAVDGVKDTVSDFGTGSAGSSLGMHGKELDKEVSPLPVKHFDFTFEAKTSGKDIPFDANSSKPGTLTSKEDPLASINPTSLGNNIRMCIRPEDQMNEILDAHGTAFKCLSSKRTEDHLNQDSHNFASNTPDREYNKVAGNHECKNNYTPASLSSIKDCLDLSNWLPPEICKIYNKKGISKLYPWQSWQQSRNSAGGRPMLTALGAVDCLQVDGVLHNRNLVYSASTSAGKSFVAEILMLRRVLATGKIALLVLPYVSICAEKAEHLEALLEPLDKHVRSFYGNQGGATLPKDTSVAVCTIEKANCLINRLLEEGRLSELGTIVIDELHMVGDQSRGYLLELMLTKLRYAAGEGNVDSSSGESSGMSSGKFDPACGLQIVGMSATLPNVAAVADWLQAALYETDFRPVPLEEYIKVGSTIYNKEMEIVRTLPKVAELGGKDPDHIVELCNEVVQEGHSVLIFCSSRKGCESTARHIAKYLKRFSVSPCAKLGEPFDVAFAIDSLRRSPAGLDPILEETLPCGVAYHHAGLTVEERETVETCYRKGLVRVLTATSTLAAGVNLPARRVIFRQPRIGRDFIDGTRYRQMAGRAGRTGIDTKGESVLICKPEETKKILAILNDSCPPLYSCLSEDRNGMTHAILEVVAGGIVQTASDIHRYVRCTLLNSTKPFEDVVKSAQDALRWLCHKKFLEWSEETKLYTSTPLGRASFGSSLCPEESLIVLDDLMRAREGFVLASDLHLVYLVTPINVDVEPDWELYYERFMQLSSLDQMIKFLECVKRFYVALILSRLVQIKYLTAISTFRVPVLERFTRLVCEHRKLLLKHPFLNCKSTFETSSWSAHVSIPGGLESFLDLWDATKEFFFDIHFTKKSELNSIAPFEIHGIAICWENTPVYYLNIPKDIFRCCSQGNGHTTGSKDVIPPKLQVEIAKKRWNRIGIIMGKKDVRKFTWNLKVQIQVLKSPAVAIHKFSNLHGGIKSLGLDLIDNSYFVFSPIHMRFAIDMSVVAWILAPDEERSSYPNLEKEWKERVELGRDGGNYVNDTGMERKGVAVLEIGSLDNLDIGQNEVKRRLSSDAAASANRSGRWKDQTRRAAHNGCCRRVAQTRALFSVLWKLLESEELVEPLMMIEVRLANVLADMEISGIGVDMEGCLRARHILGRKLKCLEREAYKLAGKTFSLSMPADIANILYEHLKLPMPEGYKGKQHPSTDKHCLDVLRNEHPIVPVIKEHRTLAKLLNSTLGSICSLARLSMRAQKYTLHGHWLQTSTATGRLSMEEPNLQCVEHMIEFKMKEDDGESDGICYKINARDFFVPTQDDWLLLTADYSQIELRLMAHFSKDYQLIRLLSSPQGDIFTMIAAKWSGKHESSVTSQERDQTKRLVYGILYGMGPSTLAEQLDCSPDEAAERIRNFRTSFPGVAAWLQEVVTSCYKKG